MGYIVFYFFLEETGHEICPSAFTVIWVYITHPVLACSCLVSMSELPITLSLSSGALFLHSSALCTGASAHTHMCLTLHQEDKNRPSLHAPRGHEVAYGLLMSPHINLRFNSESPKRRDATTSDLRGGNTSLHQPSLDRSPSPLPSFPSLLLMSLVRST